ncbi:hypothetical protein Agub_g11819 [Astrephomene gubernaculifera]|uniref:Uncharacterized protein n=1 Tax=Astrephomene gubernaculifera TaxID=47775 RepID=A0AAD3HR13_9CHLO|nr:hypothetical protein Agub_g11819 [Astrephomene gubernaculifera]
MGDVTEEPPAWARTLREDIATVQADIRDLRTGLQATVQADIRDLRTGLQATVQADIQDLRTGLQADILDLRTNLGRVRSQVDTQFPTSSSGYRQEADMTAVQEQLRSLHTLLFNLQARVSSIENVIYRR